MALLHLQSNDFFLKMPRKFNGNEILFSTNGNGTTGSLTQAKRLMRNPISNHTKQQQQQQNR